MERTTEQVLKDLQDHPEKHLHNFNELYQCSTIDGALDPQLLDAHGKYINLGTNGGRQCDTVEGPCACGAWHTREEMQKRLTDPKLWT